MKLVNLHAAESGPQNHEDWTIHTGVGQTPFGRACIACSPRGISHLLFAPDPDEEASAWSRIRRDWPHARLVRQDDQAEQWLKVIFDPAQAQALGPLAVSGTPFQLNVWRALTRIPCGCTLSYRELAERIGKPQAARAVGAAIGSNPVAWLIPCHRVVRRDGSLGGYRWGVDRKRSLLAWEQSQIAGAPSPCSGPHPGQR